VQILSAQMGGHQFIYSGATYFNDKLSYSESHSERLLPGWHESALA
jgi:hypothetical protein